MPPLLLSVLKSSGHLYHRKKLSICHRMIPLTDLVRDGKLVVQDQIHLINARLKRNLMLTKQGMVELAALLINSINSITIHIIIPSDTENTLRPIPEADVGCPVC